MGNIPFNTSEAGCVLYCCGSPSSGDRQLKYYWEAMKIWSDQLPEIDLLAEDVFVAAKNKIGNLKPSPLENFTYWNLYELYFMR